MIDQRERFERAFQLFEMPEPALERLLRRRERKQRNRRITAGVLALALVALVFGGWLRALTLDRPIPGDTPTPSPSPSAGGTVRFDSSLYGYSIDVPVDYYVTPATIPWAWGGPRRADVISIYIAIPDGTFSFDISIASIAIPDGVTAEEWQRQEEQQFRDVKAGTCRQDPTVGAIEVDGVPGRILTACDGDLFITLVVQGRGYVIATYGRAVVDHMREFRATIDSIALHPEQAPPIPESASEWRGIWPQTTREDAKAAQERADAAGSESFWQVDWMQEGIVAKRFLQEELGWDVRGSAVGYVPGDAEQAWEAEVVEWYFIRCADGTNPLYPDHPSMGDCAPTIDRTHFEQVVVRAEQLVRPGRSGIWLITGWEEVEPYEQAVPRTTEEEARALMTAFLEARVSGSGAEPLVECCQGTRVELNMYETSAGSPYVRYEFDLMGQSGSNPEWPTGEFLFRVTLFAEDGTTVEEWPYAVGPPSERKVYGCCYFEIRERAP